MEGGVTSPAPDSPATSHDTYRRMFTEAMDMNQSARARGLNCEQYYHKKQLTPTEIQALNNRRQPTTQINRVRAAVNGTLGVLVQGETDPRAWPRNPDDEDSADVATKTLRYIADYNDFDDLRVKAARDYLIQTAAAVIVEVDENHRVVAEKINPEEFFYDPRSKREDFKDARYLGVAKWVYADDASQLYPQAKEGIEQAIDTAPMPIDLALEDRPVGTQQWVDRRRRRLLIVEMYHREGGQWIKCVFHAGGILEQAPSAYLDSDKKPACPIVAQSCYVDDENIRYGVVFDMLDLQDEINKRRSKALHLLTMRQIRVSPSASTVAGTTGQSDPGAIRNEAAKPDGVFIGESGEVEVLPTNDMQAANFQMMLETKGEMDRTAAPNPALLGRQGEGQSGRALNMRQEAGLAELAIVFGGIEAWERRVYRQMWDTARQYWTAPDYIRVTDDEGSPQFIGINQPVMGQPQVMMGPNGPQIMPTILGYENALAEMDVDITLDSVPDTATLQQEQFAILSELAKLYGPQEVPFDDMLMLSSITDKQKILERRKARQEEQGQMGAVAAQAQLASAQADIQNKEADTGLKQANTVLAMAKAGQAAVQPHLDVAQMEQDAIQAASQNPAAGDYGRNAAAP